MGAKKPYRFHFELSQGMEAGYRHNGEVVEYLGNLDFVREEINESAEIISRLSCEDLDAAGVQYLVDGIMKYQSNPNNNGYLNKGVVFDSEQNELFKVTGLAVRVYDATSDFAAFLTERMLLSHAEDVEKIIVRNPNSKADVWDSTRVSPLISNCFEEHTANMKNEYAYAPKAPKEVKQLFKLAMAVLSSHQ